MVILKELELVDKSVEEREMRLDEMRNKLRDHPAFEEITRLEQLAIKYGVKIIWCPKYHCELNPIEGMWCEMKRHVRKFNDQNFEKFKSLIDEAQKQFSKSDIRIKLWHRFWKSLAMYQDGCTYQDVLVTLFGAKSRVETISHRKIANTNIK